jgi:hypothetical protein
MARILLSSARVNESQLPGEDIMATIKQNIQNAGQAAKDAAEHAGQKIKEGADTAAQKTAEAAKNAGQAVQNAGQKLKNNSGA